PLRVREAARVPVHDRVVRHPRAERVVLGAVGVVLAAALLLGVGARALLGPALAGGLRADLDRAAGDLAAARLLRELLELVGGLVDRLEVALVLELLAGRCEIGMPDLGLPAARELDVALLEGRVELQEEHCLFDVEDLRHDL
ncbi:MAG: UDP-N-acetylmuramate dehydrogenase, partial [Baekduia sp.]|nr:UDP-N-acetylmuramate dehydrogenase [Baekduia sp.]